MSRPDENPILLAMGSGESTCDYCIYELYPHAPDTICDDCGLNPMRDEASKAKFLLAAANRESGFSVEEFMTRHMLGQLSNNNDDVPEK